MQIQLICKTVYKLSLYNNSTNIIIMNKGNKFIKNKIF